MKPCKFKQDLCIRCDHMIHCDHVTGHMIHARLTLTSFSESPLHLLTMVEAEMLKNVVLHSVATALASRVLPVPQRLNKIGNCNYDCK